jgi:PAS domain S-box-containing protein
LTEPSDPSDGRVDEPRTGPTIPEVAIPEVAIPHDGSVHFDLPPETAEDLYHRAPCGYISILVDGTIARVNHTFLAWTGYDDVELVGQRRLADIVSAGGRIFLDTHVIPLLHMQGEVREVAFELIRADGSALPVLVNATLLRNVSGEPAVVRITVFDATVRHEYERELVRAREQAEASEQRTRAVALALQRSMLEGAATDGPGFEVVARYRPGVARLEIGGDWYDAFPLEDDATVGVSVGDVVGRGIAAAGAMGQVRSALRAIAVSGVGPGPVLDQLDRFVARVPAARFATVAYVEAQPATGRMRYACAGHPPPLLIGPDGGAEFLWGGRSTPLDAFPRTEPRPVGECEVEPGCRLLLYTDGLVERRTRDIDAGFDHLAATASGLADRPAAELADSLMAALLADEDTRDDVCLVVLTLAPPTP